MQPDYARPVKAFPRQTPPTRWELSGEAHSQWYAAKFAAHRERGDDLDGEARFIDALAPRSAHILDAGCGTGRMAGALALRGHKAFGVDVDPLLIKVAEDQYPAATFACADLASLSIAQLTAAGWPASFDVIAMAGNVLEFVAEQTEALVLSRLASLLAPSGRFVIGQRVDRHYSAQQLLANAAAAPLAREQLFSTWDLRPWDSGRFIVATFSPLRPHQPTELSGIATNLH